MLSHLRLYQMYSYRLKNRQEIYTKRQKHLNALALQENEHCINQMLLQLNSLTGT